MQYGRVCGVGVALILASGCKTPHAVPTDGPDPDVAIDVAIIDAMADAQVDAPPDAPVDAMVDSVPDAPSSSPACTSAPTTLLDVSPRTIVNMARSGDTLYVSATGDPFGTDALIYTIDLTTGTQPAAPLPTTGGIQLWPTDGDVFGGEYLADGTIWQFHPGSAPVSLVSHRDTPQAMTADGTYVYWSERGPGATSQNLVMRRLISGGPVEQVMSCSDTMRLVLDGPNLYCLYFTGVLRGLANGMGIPEGISYPDQGHPIFTIVKDGAALYFPAFGTGVLYRIATFGSAAVAVTTIANSPRIGGIATSSDYYYTSDIVEGVRRTHRTSLVQESVYAGATANDPILWSNQLYFEAEDPQQGGMRLVKHCVN